MDGLNIDFSKLSNYKTYNFNESNVEIITDINDKIEIDTVDECTIFEVKHNNKCTKLETNETNETYNFRLYLPGNKEKVAFNVIMETGKELIILSIYHLDTYTIFKFKPNEYCMNIIKNCNSWDEVDMEIKKNIEKPLKKHKRMVKPSAVLY